MLLKTPSNANQSLIDSTASISIVAIISIQLFPIALIPRQQQQQPFQDKLSQKSTQHPQQQIKCTTTTTTAHKTIASSPQTIDTKTSKERIPFNDQSSNNNNNTTTASQTTTNPNAQHYNTPARNNM
jgi:hypothetical protein